MGFSFVSLHVSRAAKRTSASRPEFEPLEALQSRPLGPQGARLSDTRETQEPWSRLGITRR